MSSTNFSPWFGLILGILMGWLGGWLADSWFERRRRVSNAPGLPTETAALPGEVAAVGIIASDLGTADLPVSDGLAVDALIVNAMAANGDLSGRPETPAVEEEPLPLLHYVPAPSEFERPSLKGEAGTVLSAELPGVEREDIVALAPSEEEIVPQP